jgi:hypothetical protein
MAYDREDDEARALRQADPGADGFPELPLGVEAFRSPLHTLPSDAPTRSRSHVGRTIYLVVASMAIALGVLAALAMREPSSALTDADEGLVASPALPEPAVAPVRAVKAGALGPAQTPSAPPPHPKSIASTPSTANSEDSRHTSSIRPAKRRAERRKTLASARTRAPARNVPDHPSRSAVLAAMRSVTSDARSCLSGTAVAQVHITFKGESGRVLTATVQGVQGAAASCVARAVRAARLPPFHKPQLEITFPFRAGG